MNRLPITAKTALGTVGISLLTWLLAAVPIAAQPSHDWGRTVVQIPDRTEDGSWDGTWYYVNRDERMALWIRTVDDLPQVKFQYFGGPRTEQFETDWEGKASYRNRGDSGSYTFQTITRDANVISGRLTWEFGSGALSRKDDGDVTIFRVGDGRRLALVFEEGYERRIKSDDRVTILPRHQVWSFSKASRRLVLWDELPF